MQLPNFPALSSSCLKLRFLLIPRQRHTKNVLSLVGATDACSFTPTVIAKAILNRTGRQSRSAEFVVVVGHCRDDDFFSVGAVVYVVD